jgi:hypothetical protein
VEPASPPRFESLGHAGLQNFAGLETFANPGVERVEMTSDELAALCPITLQPDMYVATIAYRPKALCLESKSEVYPAVPQRGPAPALTVHPRRRGDCARDSGRARTSHCAEVARRYRIVASV